MPWQIKRFQATENNKNKNVTNGFSKHFQNLQRFFCFCFSAERKEVETCDRSQMRPLFVFVFALHGNFELESNQLVFFDDEYNIYSGMVCA